MRFMFVAVFVALSTQVIAQEGVSNQNVDEAPAQAQSAQKTSGEVDVGVAPANPAGEKPEDAAADNAGSHPGDDLILGDGWAQWLMAITGIAALIVSAWAVWLVRRSLVLTRNAVDAAVRSADLAEKSIADGREVSQKELRAYLYLTDTININAFKDNTGKEIFEFQPSIKNYGQTPGRISRIIFSTRVVEDGNLDGLSWPNTLEGETGFFLAPGAQRMTNTFDIPLMAAKRMGPNYRLFYRVYVEYFTLFDDLIPVHTGQVFEVVTTADPDQALKGMAASHIFTFVGHSKGSSAT